MAIEKVQRVGRQLAEHLLMGLPAWPQLRRMEQTIVAGDQFNDPTATGRHNVIDGHGNAVIVCLSAENNLFGSDTAQLGMFDVVQGKTLVQMLRQMAQRRVQGDHIKLGRANKLGDKAVGGGDIDLIRRADLLHLPGAHYRDGCRQGHRLPLIVTDKFDGGTEDLV